MPPAIAIPVALAGASLIASNAANKSANKNNDNQNANAVGNAKNATAGAQSQMADWIGAHPQPVGAPTAAPVSSIPVPAAATGGSPIITSILAGLGQPPGGGAPGAASVQRPMSMRYAGSPSSLTSSIIGGSY